MMLAECEDEETGACNPCHKQLAKACDMSVDTLKKHLKILSDKGMINIVPRFEDGAQIPNQYVLNTER